MDHTIIPYGIMNGIYVENGIDIIQRAVLPVFYLRKNFVCSIRYEAFRSLKTVDILYGFRYLSGGHSFCVHGNNFLVNIRNIFLAFLYNL